MHRYVVNINQTNKKSWSNIGFNFEKTSRCIAVSVQMMHGINCCNQQSYAPVYDERSFVITAIAVVADRSITATNARCSLDGDRPVQGAIRTQRSGEPISPRRFAHPVAISFFHEPPPQSRRAVPPRCRFVPSVVGATVIWRRIRQPVQAKDQ